MHNEYNHLGFWQPRIGVNVQPIAFFEKTKIERHDGVPRAIKNSWQSKKVDSMHTQLQKTLQHTELGGKSSQSEHACNLATQKRNAWRCG